MKSHCYYVKNAGNGFFILWTCDFFHGIFLDFDGQLEIFEFLSNVMQFEGNFCLSIDVIMNELEFFLYIWWPSFRHSTNITFACIRSDGTFESEILDWKILKDNFD